MCNFGEQKGNHTIIVWFRNDLRIHDNPVLEWAINKSQDDENIQIMPIFCFDPRFYTKNEDKFLMQRKMGILRTRFSLQSVENLRENLKKIGF